MSWVGATTGLPSAGESRLAVESIIVYRCGAEIGRIVEAPSKSIEADLLDILKR